MPNENSDALEIIGIHKRRLHELKKQAVLLGPTVDPGVTLQIQELEKKIPELEREAERAVSALSLPFPMMTVTAIGRSNSSAEVSALSLPFPMMTQYCSAPNLHTSLS